MNNSYNTIDQCNNMIFILKNYNINNEQIIIELSNNIINNESYKLSYNNNNNINIFND